MKKFILLSIIASSFILLTHCKKSDPIQVRNADSEKSSFVNPKDSIGQMHNEGLKYILENTTEVLDSADILPHVKDLLYEKYDSIVIGNLPGFPYNYESLNLSYWLNQFNISTQLKNQAEITINMFESKPILDSIIAKIEGREQNASNLFSGSELELYYEHLAVAKYTAIFWYPVDQGGLNGIQFLDVNNYKSTNEVNWWKVLGVDCIGGMAGGPGGYIAASGIAVIMQL